MQLREWLKKYLASRTGRVRDPVPEDSDQDEDDFEGDLFDPFPEPIEIEIRDVFDLHTIAPQDVKRVVAEYLEEARRRGFRSVRIIHGKGRGVQREMVRGILRLTPFVESWTDAPPEAGGWGATIAHLARERDAK